MVLATVSGCMTSEFKTSERAPAPRQPVRVTEYLIADHARLHALLARACECEPFDHEAFERFRAGLLRHIGIEEKLLFAAVRERGGGELLAAAHELRLEHAALASLLVPTPDHALAREIAELLAVHDEREERSGGIYEQCERFLPEALSAELRDRASAFAEVPAARHYDGPAAHRTAASALASALRLPRRRS